MTFGAFPALTRGTGGGQIPVVESVPAWAPSAPATVGANVMSAVRVRVSRTVTVTTAKVEIGTASGNIDVGLYQSDGTTLTKLASTGSTAAAGTNALQSIALTAAATLQPGVDYYLALAADNGTVTFGRVAGISSIAGSQKMSANKTSSFPLPSPTIALSALSGTSSAFWIELS